jgi:prophage regulatory protein
MSEQTKLQKLIRKADLPDYTGLQRTTIAELIKDGKFPKPIPLTDEGRARAWLESEVLAWQARRIAQRDQV